MTALVLLLVLAGSMCWADSSSASGMSDADNDNAVASESAASATSTSTSSGDATTTFLAPSVLWVQRRSKLFLKVVENHIEDEQVNITRRGVSLTFTAGACAALRCAARGAPIR